MALFNFLSKYIYLFGMHLYCVGTCVPQNARGEQRTTCMTPFSASYQWGLGFRVRQSGMAANSVSHCTILLSP